jgi:foldase protein PrsA
MLKRCVSILLFIFIAFALSPRVSSGETEPVSVVFNNVSIFLDGKKLDLASIGYNGRIYVPLESVGRYFNSGYENDGESGIINIVHDFEKGAYGGVPPSLAAKKGQGLIYANRNKYSFRYEGVITYLNSIYYQGINFVPLRYYSELFFKKINWIPEENKIEILTPPGEVIAVVNGEGVERRDFDSFCTLSLNKIEKQADGQDPKEIEAQKKKAREENYNYFVTRQVLKQKAAEYKIVLEQKEYDALNTYLDNYVGGAEEIEAYRAQLARDGACFQQVALYNRDNFLLQKLHDEVTKEISATEAQIKKYYEDNKATFVKPEAVTLKHILISTVDADKDEKIEKARKTAQDVSDKIKAGADFDALMKQYSQDPELKENPDGYTFSKGQMIKGFQEAALALEVGQISDVVRSPYGFHIIKLLDKTPERPMTFDEARGDIQSALDSQMKDEYYNELVDQWIDESQIDRIIDQE